MKIALIVGYLLLLGLDCSRHDTVSVTETDTGVITGWVTGPDRQGIGDADVILHNADKVKAVASIRGSVNALAKRTVVAATNSDSAKTSPAGFFTFESVKIGHYYIEVNDHDSRGAVAEVFVTEDDPEPEPDTLVVGHFGTIKGSLYNTSADSNAKYIYIIEIDRKVPIDSLGRFLVDNVPARDYTVRLIQNGLIIPSLLDTLVISVVQQDTAKAYNIGTETGSITIKGTIGE